VTGSVENPLKGTIGEFGLLLRLAILRDRPIVPNVLRGDEVDAGTIVSQVKVALHQRFDVFGQAFVLLLRTRRGTVKDGLFDLNGHGPAHFLLQLEDSAGTVEIQ
jgi:hypothetical protein